MTAFVRAAALVLAAASAPLCALAQTPASPNAAPQSAAPQSAIPPSADELFARARAAAVRRIAHLPPYVAYHLDADFNRKGKPHAVHYDFLVRTSDGATYAQPVPDSPRDKIDATPSVATGEEVFSPFTAFDLRPRRPGEHLSQFEPPSSPEPAPTATTAGVIGRTTAVTKTYDVTLVGREDLNGVPVWHLHTKANFDEDHHPLADIYMRVDDDEPLRIAIRLNGSAGPVHVRPTIAFDYRDFDGTWMVAHVATELTLRMLFLSFGGTFSATISHVSYPADAPDWKFDAKLLAAHLRAEKDAASPAATGKATSP